MLVAEIIVISDRDSVGVREDPSRTSTLSAGFCTHSKIGLRLGQTTTGLEGTIADVLAGKGSQIENYAFQKGETSSNCESINGPDWLGDKGRMWVGLNVERIKGEVERRKRGREEADERSRKLVRAVLRGAGMEEVRGMAVEGDKVWDVIKRA